MKTKSTIQLVRSGSPAARLLAISIAALLAAHSAQASTLYWDTNGNGAGSGATTGFWGVSNFWDTASDGTTSASFLPLATSADNLYISAGTNGTTGTITVVGAPYVAANSLTFQNNVAVTINGQANINLGSTTGAGIFVASGDNAANTISAPIVLGAASTIQNAGTGILTLSGGITGAYNLTLQNNAATAGGVILSGNNFINNAGTITNNGSGVGLTISAPIGYNVTGVTQNSSNSALTLSAANFYQGNTLIAAGTLVIGNNAALQNSALDTSGSGVVTLSSSTTPTFGGLINSGNLSSVITTGYSSMTGLTLNLGSGVTDAYSGIISNGAANTNLTLTGVYGPGKQVLAGANTYTGTTTISGGTLQIGNGLSGSLNGAGTASAFVGALTFNGNGGTLSVQEAASSTQGMGALTFSAGSNTVNSTFNATSAALTFSSLAARTAGASGNFTLSGGTNGSTNSINLTGVAAGFVDKGIYFNGADFAAMNAAGTYVRALAYGSDANAAAINAITASNHVELSATPAARAGDTLLSLNLSGSGVGYTMNSGSLSVPGILKSGGGTVGIISGGTSLTTASNAELVIRTDTPSDLLKISTPITSFIGGLTKTGAGTLTLDASNGYTGTTTVVAGKLAESANGLIADTSALTINGPTAIFDLGASHNDTVAAVTLAGGGQITGSGTSALTGSSFALQNGSVSAILNSGAVTKSTNGTVTLTGNTTTGGGLTVSAGSLVITGSGAQYKTLSGGSTISGIGSSITVSAGAAFNTGQSSGNLSMNGTGGSILVTGYGSNLAQGTNAYVGTGNNAIDNSLTIANGATATFATLYVAQGNNLAGPLGNTFTVTGLGSSATVGTAFEPFDSGQNGLVAVLNGGTLTTPGAYTGYYANAKYNQILVDGAGSRWTTPGISTNNSGTYNSITVSNNGLIVFTGGEGFSSSNNPMNIASGGVVDASGLTLGSNTLNFNGGILQAYQANGANVSGGGIVLAGAGTVNTNSFASTISSPISGAGALYKTGAGTLTISTNTNTYTGGTNVNGGTLLLSGAIGMPATGTLAVGAGGTYSLVDAAARSTTVPALSLAGGANLAFDLVGTNGVDALTSTAAATTSGGTIGISITGSGTPAVNTATTLLSSPTGGLTTGGTNYFVANNTNYTATLNQSSTAVQIATYTPGITALTNAYWLGGQLSNALGAMALSSGTVSNWASAAAGTSAGGVVPGGSGINVIFGATGSAQQANVTTGADMNLGSITFNDSTSVILGGSNAITLNNTSATAAATTAALATITNAGSNTCSAISVTSYANATNTITANLALALGQTWNIASGKSLVVNGVINGNSTLALAGAGNLTLTGANIYSGTTTIGSGTTLQLGNSSTTGSLSILSAITDNGTLVLNRSNNVTQGIDFVAVSGTGALTQSGGATLYLTNPANSYTGVTTISSGILNAAGFAAIGTNSPIGAGVATNPATNAASLVINGGTLQYSGSTLATTNRLFTIGTSGATLDASGTGAGTLTLGSAAGSIAFSNSSAPALLGLTGTGTGALSAVLGNSGTNPNVTSLTKSGTGLWTLTAANTYTGTTAVNNGTLAISGSGTLGNAAALTMGGGMLDLGTSSQTVGAISITAAAASGNTIQNGSLTGSSYAASNTSGNAMVTAGLLVNGSIGFTMSGAGGTVTLAGANTYTGTTAVNAGTLAVSGSGTLGNGAALALGGGTLDLGTTSQTAGALSITAAAASGDTFKNGSITATSYAASNSSGEAIVSANLLVNGSAGLNMSGAGILTLKGANTYTGGTDISNGEVQMGGSGTLGNTSGSLTINSGMLDLNGTSQSVGNLTGSGGTIANDHSSGTATLTIGTGNYGGGNYAGVIADNSGSGTGKLALAKTGTASITLGNTNTYSGATTVSAGGLVVSGNLGNTAVAVSPGATFSAQPGSGSGYAGTSATVGTSGLTLSGGASSAGNFSMVDNAIGSFRFGTGGLTTITSTVLPMLTFEIGGSAGSIDCLDLGAMGGNASIAAGTKVNFQTLSGASSLATGDYTFLKTAASGLGASMLALNSSTMTVGGTVYTLSLSGSSSTQEILHVAPAITTTPTTYALTVNASTSSIHVGGSATITATISNTGIAPQDSLDYTSLTLSNAGQLTGTWPKAANASPIACGATNTNAGSISGATAAGTYSFTPSVASATNHTIGNGGGAPSLIGTSAATVDVYALASPVFSTGLGSFHVGAAKALGLTNGSAGDHNEDLNASISAGTNTSASGSLTDLLAGATDSTHLLVTLGGGAGLQTGQVSVDLTSTGTVAGVSNALGATVLASQTVSISGTGYNLAAAAATQTVNLSVIHVGGTGSASVTLTNSAPADATYSETLGSGLFSSSSPGITTGGLVSGIIGGGSGSGTLSVGFDSSVTAGAGKSGTTTLALNSSAVNGSGLGTTSAGPQTITVTGDVFNGSGIWQLTSDTSGSWGTHANWTDANGVSGAPGTFTGSDNVDTATFNGTGTATTIFLDTTSPSLKALTFSGGMSYTIAQGSGSNKLILKSSTGTATATVAGSQMITAPVTLTSNSTFDTALVSDVLTISGNVDGAASSLTKTGSGTLTLGGTNTYTGGTTINGGTLDVASLSTTGAIAFNNGGILEYTGAGSLGTYTLNDPGSNSPFAINVTNAAGNFTVARAAGHYVGLTKGGAGTLTIANSGNQDGGTVTVNEGTVLLNGISNRADWYDDVSGVDDVKPGATLKLANSNIGQVYYGGGFTMSGGTFDVNGQSPANDEAHSVPAVSGSGTITNNSTSAAGRAVFQINGTPAFSGSIVDGGTKALAITIAASTGTGIWILSGTNTYSGATTINNGTLEAASTTALSPNSAYSLASGKTLDLANFNNSIGSLTGAGNLTLGSATLTLGNDSTSPTFSGAISGAGGVIKTGGGNQTLSGSIGYGGDTTVSQGVLSLGTVNFSNAASSVTIAASGATIHLGFATSNTVKQLYIGTTLQAPGDYIAMDNLGAGTKIAQLTGTGTLHVTSGTVVAGFDSWAATNGATGQTMVQDHDNDGVPNGIEYFLGGNTNTTGFTKVPGMVNNAGILSITWPKAADYTGAYGSDYVVETSTTLNGDWAPESSPGTVTIVGNNVTYTFPAGPSAKFARLKVVK